MQSVVCSKDPQFTVNLQAEQPRLQDPWRQEDRKYTERKEDMQSLILTGTQAFDIYRQTNYCVFCCIKLFVVFKLARLSTSTPTRHNSMKQELWLVFLIQINMWHLRLHSWHHTVCKSSEEVRGRKVKRILCGQYTHIMDLWADLKWPNLTQGCINHEESLAIPVYLTKLLFHIMYHGYNSVQVTFAWTIHHHL
jgi:hypothetical protein